MTPFVNVDDFQQAARRHLPRIFADYIDGGAFSETTMRRNRADFERYAIRQLVLAPLDQTADLSVSTLGRRSALPFGPGPVGFLGLYRRDGDIRVARAAAKADIPFVLSTFSINGLETIRKDCGRTPDFQLYLDRDPQVNESHLAACREQGVERIFLTVDTAITSVRERDVRNGFRATDRMTPQLLWQFAKRPIWSLDLLRGGFPDVELVKGRPEFGKGALAQASKLSARLEKNLTWETVAELRRQWEGKLILKGISDPTDAERAARAGVDGIVLSNHGGRQLDHATSTFARLRDVRAALGPDLALYIDSGFRRGTDVVKALALGADFILMGRPFAWAVAADGERGVTQLVDLLREEIAITLNLAGLSSVAELKKAGASTLIDLSDKDA
ncbi:alpha-hydroxy acid oxidase [Antarcticimicrobium sediminis]|uniref:Alpha-hydroxy-acid oxidizing protein n=1 Tax=Antarcticimicrobium sediminis TaxID=2546227 RepID=A0A4R5EIY5_9RHOB|nr:alpha-hydroxy acid oxidase [Antarcticimicrobium sediminis]TDE34364.1 alpha-hydroxy-acid oxidizing protein [Antarcticimicrobium sediminis]